MDVFKLAANKGIGPGGLKCPCCCDRGHKVVARRGARHRLKAELKKLIDE